MEEGKGRHALCFPRAHADPVLLQGVLAWLSPSESKKRVLRRQSGPIWWVPGGLPQGHRQQL